MVKRTEITIETREVVVIRTLKSLPLAHCAACGEAVPMATVAQAAAIAGVVPHSISERVEHNRVHAVQTPDGGLLICINSLVP